MASKLKRASSEESSDGIPSKRSSPWRGPSPSPSSNGQNRMRVHVRVRPLNDGSERKTVIDVIDKQMLVFDPKDDDNEEYVYHGRKYKEIGRRQNKNLQFVFDRVFDDTCSNIQVYENSTKSFVNSLLNGYNCAVFAYGATGSGKTHTMLGSIDDPGVIFFTTMDLFRQLEERSSNDENLELSISYFEIYNEIVFDLLDPTSGKALAVREDSQRGVVVSNLSVHQPKDANHLLEMLEFGNKNRTQHPTDANAESSRSHAIFQISLKKKDFSSTQEMSIQISKMSLIDLAGSERATVAYKTNRSKGLQREGGNINKSLLALGNCITALANLDPRRKTSPHIPYRNSKLTLLLRDSLGGNCQTAMIATVSPSNIHYEETHSTLTYANRAKGIQLNLRRNSFSIGVQPRHYANLIESLNRKNTEQSEQIIILQNELQKLRNHVDRAPIDPIVARSDSNEKLNAVKNSLEILFEERLELRRQLMECESSLKKIDLRLLFRKLDSDRLKVMMSDDKEESLGKNDPLQALYNQKLHYSHQKASLEKEVEDNEMKIKRYESDLKEQTGPNDWLIDTFFKDHNMITEFKDKSYAERHSIELTRELLTRLELNEETLSESVKLNRHAYHCLNGMGRLSEELGNAFSALLRKVEGKKSVVWRDDVLSPNLIKRNEVEKIFTLPTYNALPKTPLANNTRSLVSVCSITPSYSFKDHTPEKIQSPLKALNSVRSSLLSNVNRSNTKVAIVPAFNAIKDNDDENELNGTFTIDNEQSSTPPRPQLITSNNNREPWRGSSQNQRHRTNTYNSFNNRSKSSKYKSRTDYSSPRYGRDQWNSNNRDVRCNYSPYRDRNPSNYNSGNKIRDNGCKSPNQYNRLPRFRF